MAQRVNVILEDDLDGSEATETVTFGLDGSTYEIDLNDKNSAALRKALAKFVEKGRKVSKGRTQTSGRRTSAASTGSANPPKLVREWAEKNGHTVPARGRIPQAVQDAYAAAH